MSKTLILLFHPNLAKSRANAALAGAASRLAGADVVDMYELYPDGKIDADVEVERLLSAERIVLQFPIYWYSSPSLLNEWQNAVLTRMYYMAYETEGRLLEGTPLLVAVTAGNIPEAYSASGTNFFPMEEILNPLRAMSHRCKLAWQKPYVFYNSMRCEGADLKVAASAYAEVLMTGSPSQVPAEKPALAAAVGA